MDQIPKAIKGGVRSVGKLIESRAQMDNLEEICDVLGKHRGIASRLTLVELKPVYDRDVELLSGGELQRFAIGTVCVQKADVVRRSAAARLC